MNPIFKHTDVDGPLKKTKSRRSSSARRYVRYDGEIVIAGKYITAKELVENFPRRGLTQDWRHMQLAYAIWISDFEALPCKKKLLVEALRTHLQTHAETRIASAQKENGVVIPARIRSGSHCNKIIQKMLDRGFFIEWEKVAKEVARSMTTQ